MATYVDATGEAQTVNLRDTEAYKKFDPLAVIMCIEEGGEDPLTTLAAWQWVLDTGMYKQLQGFYGRTCRDLLDVGMIDPPLSEKGD